MAKSKHKFKRRSNAALKLRRARSWARGVKLRELRKATQKAAQRANQEVSTSPWKTACLTRAARRATDPAVQSRRLAWAAQRAADSS